MSDPSYDVESNVAASVRWLSRLGETSLRRIIFVSSGGTVYGNPQSTLIDENHPTNPTCSYGITKLALEKYIAMYAGLANIDYLIMRPSNIYGKGQHLDHGQGVIGVLIDRALRGRPLEVWGTGENLRDYLHIDDFISAVGRILSYDGSQRLFNVSSGVGHSVLEILEILRRQLANLPEIKCVPSRGFDVPVNILDSSRLRDETGWQPTLKLEEGIANVIEWLRDERLALARTNRS
jgi:UDP-glucose 4-epimerase